MECPLITMMYRNKFKILEVLTLFNLFTSAPLDNNSSTTCVSPISTALCKGVSPAYNVVTIAL